MNKKQLIVLWIGIAIIVVMGLFPPWMFPAILPNLSGGVYWGAGYHFIITPPNILTNIPKMWIEAMDTSSICHIDIPRLLSQWILVAVVTGGLLVTLKDKKKD